MNRALLSALLVSGCAATNHRLPDVATELPPKDPGMAAVMSFALPGAGEVYSGRLMDGYMTFGRQVLVWPALAVASLYLFPPVSGNPNGILGLAMIGGGTMGFIAGHMAATEAAYRAAETYNGALATRKAIKQ